MKKTLALLAAVLTFSFCAFAGDPPKPAEPPAKPTKKNLVIVFVDLNRLLTSSELFQRMRANLKAAAERSNAALQVKNDELVEKRKAYIDDEPKMTPDEKSARTREIEVLQKEYSLLESVHKGMYADKQMEADRIFKKALGEVMGALSRENGWDVVFNRAFENVLWNSEAVEQTDVVIRRLNALPIPENPLTAPLPPAPAASSPPAPAPGAAGGAEGK